MHAEKPSNLMQFDAFFEIKIVLYYKMCPQDVSQEFMTQCFSHIGSCQIGMVCMHLYNTDIIRT